MDPAETLGQSEWGSGGYLGSISQEWMQGLVLPDSATDVDRVMLDFSLAALEAVPDEDGP